MSKKIKHGQWVYNIQLGKVGIVRDVGWDHELEEIIAEVAYPAPSDDVTIVYYVGGSAVGLTETGKQIPIVEVLTTTIAVMRLLEELIPIAETVWAGLVRMWRATFGTEEQKQAVAAFRQAKAMEKQLRG